MAMVGTTAESTAEALARWVDLARAGADARLDPTDRTRLGQFSTPMATAKLMASMFAATAAHERLLDAGAGVGTLTAAWISELCARPIPPRRVSVVSVELDRGLLPYLEDTLHACRSACERAGIDFEAQILDQDFIEVGAEALRGGMFASPLQPFTSAILNPPYRKINAKSHHRRLLGSIGVETSNLYTAFVSIAVRLLAPGGEIVAITPRSFCNGPYFRQFRRTLLQEASLRRIHLFQSRDTAFRDHGVLQENIILRAVRGAGVTDKVVISSSTGPHDRAIAAREVPIEQVVRPDDADAFIRIVPDESGDQTASRMAVFRATLSDLTLGVSTGRVVDFRAERFLRAYPAADTAPLIYPGHCRDGFVQWPKLEGRKPNALVVCPETTGLLVRAGTYVLVRRFSAAEERRRVVAVVHDPDRVPGEWTGFENHLNYYHRAGEGLPRDLAMGLSIFLNSTLVDHYFRQFNGHTQVNATDLRSLRYPTEDQLITLGSRAGETYPTQAEIDHIVETELPNRASAGHS